MCLDFICVEFENAILLIFFVEGYSVSVTNHSFLQLEFHMTI